MPDTHDERSGDADPYDWDPVYAAATIAELQKQLAAATEDLRLAAKRQSQLEAEVLRLATKLATATARAESATVLPERWRALIAERDAAVRRAEKAEARLAERQPIRAEWSTENAYYRPGDDVVSQELAARRVIAHPGIHTAVLRRQLYAGPWVPADQACRSCGETDRVAGDPPLCSNCAVYGPTYRGVACWPPIAAPDARSATETAEDGVQASGSELEFEGRSAGLSGPRPKPRRQPIQGSGYTPLQMLGVVQDDNERDDTTEDDRG